MPPKFPLHIQAEVLRILGIHLFSFAYGAITLCRASFQKLWLRKLGRTQVLQHHISFTSSIKDSVCTVALLLAVTNAISIDFFSWGYEDASTHPVLIPYGIPEDFSGWMSYSEISGSKAVCAYPKLIAAYHVLLRQPKPSHPPNGVESKQIALSNRIIFHFA